LLLLLLLRDWVELSVVWRVHAWLLLLLLVWGVGLLVCGDRLARLVGGIDGAGGDGGGCWVVAVDGHAM
jgi:hypothetical protein